MAARFSAEEFIDRLADVADRFGDAASVGAMETAGLVLSFLAEHPDWLGAFMKGGIDGIPDDFHLQGRLTWHAQNGKIVSPAYARRARTVRDLLKGAKAA